MHKSVTHLRFDTQFKHGLEIQKCKCKYNKDTDIKRGYNVFVELLRVKELGNVVYFKELDRFVRSHCL